MRRLPVRIDSEPAQLDALHRSTPRARNVEQASSWLIGGRRLQWRPASQLAHWPASAGSQVASLRSERALPAAENCESRSIVRLAKAELRGSARSLARSTSDIFRSDAGS